MHLPTHARLCALPMLWFIHKDTLLSDGKAYPKGSDSTMCFL